jgi:hypothetical protein
MPVQGLLCSCCPGPEKDSVVGTAAAAAATEKGGAVAVTEHESLKGGSSDAVGAASRSSLQGTVASSQEYPSSKPVPARASAARQQQEEEEEDTPATRSGDEKKEEKEDKGEYGVFAGKEYPAQGSVCCRASCNGARRANAYECACCTMAPEAASDDGKVVGATSREQNREQHREQHRDPETANDQPRVAGADEEDKVARQGGGNGGGSRVRRALHRGGAQTRAPIKAQRGVQPKPAVDSGMKPQGGGSSSSSSSSSSGSSIDDGSRQPAVSDMVGAGRGGGSTSRRTGATRQPREGDDRVDARNEDAVEGANGAGVNPREIYVGPMGTNTVFMGTHDEGGVHRVRDGHSGMDAHLREGKYASRVSVESLSDESSNSTSASSSSREDERRPLSWDKSWWPAKGWILWALSGPTLTVLIFILNTWTQGWECGVIYAAILLPLDLMTFYFDLYAYDDGELYWFELALAISFNMCLCVCLIPAYSASQMLDHERRSFGGGYYDPYGFPPPGHGYGATGGGYGGNYQPFRGEGQPTGYGVRTERTQLV